MGDDIVLSFCIPTYNSVLTLQRLVLSILECDRQDIEVVVLDNGSTDNTLRALKEISDARLQVFSNGINKGALFNMINVLNKGSGTYMVYCTDHDHIDTTKIESFVDFFKDNKSVACGYCEYYSLNKTLFKLIPSGYQALEKLAYVTRHPTGYFFKRELWQLRDCVNNFADYGFVDLFPLEFVFAELSLLGDGAIYYDSLFEPERGEKLVREHRSATTDGKSKTAFFSPQTRLKLANSFEKHLRTLPISKVEQNRLRINSFFRELFASTFGYRKVMLNEPLCEHYYMEKKNIGIIGLLSLTLDFIGGYHNQIVKGLFLSYPERIKFYIGICSKIIPKVLEKTKPKKSIYS